MEFDVKGKTVLALSPHTDDIELSCGGTLSKFLERGAKVYCAVFSICRDSVPEGFPKDVLGVEVRKSLETLGVLPENLTVLDFDVRTFEAHRQAVLDELIKLRRALKPDLVLAPSTHDTHQDHYTLACEARRAFKGTTLLAYEMPWNCFTFDFQCFSVLEKRHLDAKAAALANYETQKGRDYFKPDFITAQARVNGTRVGAEFAEAFECPRLIIG